VNDILHRALSRGDYSTGMVTPTAAPSMDIQVSSNFERLLFDLHDRDPAQLAAAMQAFERGEGMRLPEPMRAAAAADFASARVDHEAMAAAMRWAHDAAGQVIDPHSAIGLAAAREAALPADVPVVTLATAHPAKFGDAVAAAIGVRPALPERIAGLMEREERYATLPATFAAVTDYVAARASVTV
jgi:threonine synthase